MGPIPCPRRVFRFRTLRQHFFEELPIASTPVGTDRVVAGIVSSTGIAKIGSGTSLEQEIAKRTADRVWTTGTLLEDAGTTRCLLGPSRTHHHQRHGNDRQAGKDRMRSP
jgi:hypothetical protein